MKKSRTFVVVVLCTFCVGVMSSCSSGRKTCNGRGGWYKNRNVQLEQPQDKKDVQQVAFTEIL
jgi:hypothetical protein